MQSLRGLPFLRPLLFPLPFVLVVAILTASLVLFLISNTRYRASRRSLTWLSGNGADHQGRTSDRAGLPQSYATADEGAGMFWEHCTAMLLARLIPSPHRDARRTASISSGTGASVARYGCCPACREFVSIKPSNPAGDAPCPVCGHRIGPANPLRPIGSEDDPPGVGDGEMDG